MGAGYKKEGKDKWQLLNYLSGEAKMAIYISRKNVWKTKKYRIHAQSGSVTSWPGCGWSTHFIKILEIWTLLKIAGAIKTLSVLVWTCCLYTFLKDNLLLTEETHTNCTLLMFMKFN